MAKSSRIDRTLNTDELIEEAKLIVNGERVRHTQLFESTDFGMLLEKKGFGEKD